MRIAHMSIAMNRNTVFLAALALCLLAGCAAWSALAHAPHLIALAALGVALLAGVLRAGRASAAWMTAAVILLALSLPNPFRPGAHGAGGCEITAITFNAKLQRIPDEAAMLQALSRNVADVVFLQEAPPTTALLQRLRASPDYGGHHVAVSHRLRLVILSRFPLASREDAAGWLTTEAQLPDGARILLLAALVPKPHLRQREHASIVAGIEDRLARAEGRFLAGIDLNAGPASGSAHRIAALGADAHWAAGTGFGFTFPTSERRMGILGPWLRIDYLFAGPRLVPAAVETLPDRGRSTHLPLRGEFVLRDSLCADPRISPHDAPNHDKVQT
jgi:endonuclease/exonuclease/phosphatase (EEP) superfamily protein YafD